MLTFTVTLCIATIIQYTHYPRINLLRIDRWRDVYYLVLKIHWNSYVIVRHIHLGVVVPRVERSTKKPFDRADAREANRNSSRAKRSSKALEKTNMEWLEQP